MTLWERIRGQVPIQFSQQRTWFRWFSSENWIYIYRYIYIDIYILYIIEYYRYVICMNFLESTHIAGLHGWWPAWAAFNRSSVWHITIQQQFESASDQWNFHNKTKNYSYPPTSTSSHIIPYHSPFLLIKAICCWFFIHILFLGY